LNGTNDKSGLGANAILGRSLTLARASAPTPANSLLYRTGPDQRKPVMPLAMMNIINRENILEISVLSRIQADSHIVKTFRDALRSGAEIYRALRSKNWAKVSGGRRTLRNSNRE